jgi:general secretion pathway protein A
VTADGRRYAAVTGLGDDTAMLELGSRQVTVPVREIDAYWDGTFVVLWRSPFPAGHRITPGHRGRDVEWIRDRLSALTGEAITGSDPQLYDAELARRVRDFQRSQRLVPDAIAGDETLLHLTMAPDGSATPTLVPAGP